MQIKTKRLTIRTFVPKDIDDVFEIYRYEEVCKWLLHDAWKVDCKMANFNKKVTQNSLHKDSVLSLACVLEDKVIGDISIWYTDMKDTVEIGYAYHKDYAGMGYATESLKEVTKNLFKMYDIHRIQANLDARNIASAKLCENIGMRKEAHFMKDYWNKGEWTDSFVYGMLISDIPDEEMV